MKKTPLIYILFILFMGCYTTTRNPEQSTYYDGFREDESAVTDESEIEAVYDYTDDIVTGNNYYYDPYYMNRYMATRYDHAWYWRGMYRPYGYRHQRNFSMYFGYSCGSIGSSWNDYYSYDPYYDCYFDDHSYWSDYYSPYNNYYGSVYRPYSYYPRTVVYVTDEDSQPSNERRGYNRLGQTGGGISSPNPNPVPYNNPYIAIIPPSIEIRPGRTSVSIEKLRKPIALESNDKKRNKSKEAKTRTASKSNKEASKSTHKKSSAKSTKNKPRKEVMRSKPSKSSHRKSSATKSKSKSKKSDN